MKRVKACLNSECSECKKTYYKATDEFCVKCGSKLNKSYFRGEKCPLCYADLRSKSVLEKIKGFDDKIALLRKEKEEICRPRATVMWLVWFEYNS
jgi:predicted amidophosphoribosyltransferase